MKIIKNGDLDILLSQAFQAFWKRINLINPSPLTRISMEENGITYFIALDLAIGHKKNYKLIGLLNEMVQPPEEFLPIVAEIINGVPNKKGRPNIFTYCTRLSLYYQMCEQSILEGREISTISAQMASEFIGPGEAPDKKTFERIWQEFKDEKHIKEVFMMRKQYTPILG